MKYTAFAVILLLAACQLAPSPEVTDAQRAAIEQIVRDQAEEYFASLAALDADRAMAHLAQDDLSIVSNGVHYPSYEALSDHLREVISSMREIQGGWDKIRVIVLSQDAAVLHGRFNVLYTYTDGNTVNFPEGFWTALHERHDGEWEMVLVHTSARPVSTERE